MGGHSTVCGVACARAVRGLRALGVRVCSRYARQVPSRVRPIPLRLRAGACLLCLAAMLALAGTGAAPALATSLSSEGALGQLTEAAPEETNTTTTATSTSSAEPTTSHTTILLVLAAAVLVLSGIAFVIVRDARRVAPATEREMIEGSAASDTAARMRKRRAKAKAARQQRKRNR
jgi:hypothetical protein